jgi:hypothetical protein
MIMDDKNINRLSTRYIGSWLLIFSAAQLILWSGATIASQLVQGDVMFIGTQSANSTDRANGH